MLQDVFLHIESCAAADAEGGGQLGGGCLGGGVQSEQVSQQDGALLQVRQCLGGCGIVTNKGGAHSVQEVGAP